MDFFVSYEEAVRLKDLGFPQPGEVTQHSIDPRYENGVYVPTLDEAEAFLENNDNQIRK